MATKFCKNMHVVATHCAVSENQHILETQNNEGPLYWKWITDQKPANMNIKTFTVPCKDDLAELKQQISQKIMLLLHHGDILAMWCRSNIIFCDICCFSSASHPYKALWTVVCLYSYLLFKKIIIILSKSYAILHGVLELTYHSAQSIVIHHQIQYKYIIKKYI